jgi:hypothetical protein
MTDHFARDWLDPHGDAAPVIDGAAYIRKRARDAGVTDDPPFPPLALAHFHGVEIGPVLTVSDQVFDTARPQIFHTDEFTANLAATRAGGSRGGAGIVC